jgi:hypothetical protein
VVREAVASSFMRRLRISSSELSLLSSFHLSSAPSLSFPSFSFFSSFPCFRSPSALLVWKKAELQGKTSETNYAQKAMMSLFLTHLFFGITKARYNIVTCDMQYSTSNSDPGHKMWKHLPAASGVLSRVPPLIQVLTGPNISLLW